MHLEAKSEDVAATATLLEISKVASAHPPVFAPRRDGPVRGQETAIKEYRVRVKPLISGEL